MSSIDSTKAFPVLDCGVPEQYRGHSRSEFAADVWYKIPGCEGEYSEQKFSLPHGASGEDLIQLLGRQSRVLVALSHFSWGYGTLAAASEDREVAEALLQLASDDNYRKKFGSIVTKKIGKWDPDQDLETLAPQYFPYEADQKGNE
jgi:hypothetical protein